MYSANNELGDFFADVKKYLDQAEAGYRAVDSVRRGDTRPVLVPTQQGLSRYATPTNWAMLAAIGGAAVVAYIVLKRR